MIWKLARKGLRRTYLPPNQLNISSLPGGGHRQYTETFGEIWVLWVCTMRRLTVWIAAVWFSLPLVQTAAQTPVSSGVLERAGALQTKLREWQAVLTNSDLGAAPITDSERKLINQDRSATLAATDVVIRDINELARSPSNDAEARLVLDLNQLGGKLSSLSDSLRAVRLATLGGQLPQPWPPIDDRIIPEVQRYYYELNLQFMKQLNSLSKEGAANTSSEAPAGEISGHIYRADTGKPLAGAMVMLASTTPPDSAPRSRLSGDDGSYEFTRLPPGDYSLSAYMTGFARAEYGLDKAHGSWFPLTLPSEGERNRIFRGPTGATAPAAVNSKLININLSLNPVPEVSEMNGEALLAATLDQRVFIQFQYGSFSPDGKFFAVTSGDPDPQAAWFYDLATARLTPVIAPEMGGPHVISMGWDDDTLYVEQSHRDPGGGRFFAANTAGVKEITKLPPAGEEPLKNQLGYDENQASNDRFVVTAQGPEHGAFALIAQAAGGHEKFTIAEGSWELQSFVLLPERSLVVYPTFYYSAIVAFNLNARKRQETFLPVRAERLLAVRPQADGLLIAYSTHGPCDPGNPGSDNSFEPRYRPKNVCFATIPATGEK